MQSLLESLDEVVKEAKEHRELGHLELHVLWIDGRSGCGKSVLLLQLMQRLVQERRAPILWLQNNVAALPEVIKRWNRYDIPSDQPAYIFLDDFYTQNH